jgi:hypothetical protein
MGSKGKGQGFVQKGLGQSMYKSMCTSAFKQKKELSAKATGILYYLLSKPDGWKGQMFDIQDHFVDGASSIRSGVKELCDAGYLDRIHNYEEGKFRGSYYQINEKSKTKR